MLDPRELAETAAAFGVADEQVRRDHLISHVLAALSELEVPVIFFGGTGLARTHLSEPGQGGRLSEDVDLWSSNRRKVAEMLDVELPRRMRREFPRTTWQPGLSQVRSPIDPAQLVTADGLRLKIQLLDVDGAHQDWKKWPTEVRTVQGRYSDVGPIRLRLPTLDAFVAMKLSAWADRRAARDLYDLAALARGGMVTAEAARLAREVSGLPVTRTLFSQQPAGGWEDQLAHQTATLPTASEALQEVFDTFAEVLAWPAPFDPLA